MKPLLFACMISLVVVVTTKPTAKTTTKAHPKTTPTTTAMTMPTAETATAITPETMTMPTAETATAITPETMTLPTAETATAITAETMTTTSAESTTTMATTGTAVATTGQHTIGPTEVPPTGTWAVKNDKGDVCMMMQFGARLEIIYTNTSLKLAKAIIDAPATASPKSKCETTGPRTFTLNFFNIPNYFYVNFTFNRKSEKSNFVMSGAGNLISITKDHFKNPLGVEQRSTSIEADNILHPSVPSGKSFACGHAIEIEALSLTLTDVKLQPYAEDSQGHFGGSVKCENPSKDVTGIVLIVVFILVFAAVITGVVVVIWKKKQKSKPDEKERLVN